MPSNNTGQVVKDLLDRFPGRIAHLFAPGKGTWRFPLAEYAIDNGAYGMRETGGYPHGALLDLVARVERHECEWGYHPMWVAVPDVVYQAKATLEQWKWASNWIRNAHFWKVALVVQDGMTPEDVWRLGADDQPDVIFVGGSTEWKWSSLPMWTAFFPRVHVGRVNAPSKLWECHRLGVESVDGTGWAMATAKRPNQIAGLVDFLARTSRAA